MHKILFTLLSLWCYQSVLGQITTPNIAINIPSIEQEATSIWRTINDIEFLEGQGYRVHLPEHEMIDSLIAKSKEGQFGNEDFSGIYQLLESEIYQESDYDSALMKVKDQENFLNRTLSLLADFQKSWKWEFKTFSQYKIIFTLYGTGGSYSVEEGSVTLFTNQAGKFMNYDNPANTIIHEIVHIGIEDSIIQKYNIPHGTKERIVDTMVKLLFGNYLPEYKIQNMGDKKLDEYIRRMRDLKKLHKRIEDYLGE